jgi:hypothetical protein
MCFADEVHDDCRSRSYGCWRTLISNAKPFDNNSDEMFTHMLRERPSPAQDTFTKSANNASYCEHHFQRSHMILELDQITSPIYMQRLSLCHPQTSSPERL